MRSKRGGDNGERDNIKQPQPQPPQPQPPQPPPPPQQQQQPNGQAPGNAPEPNNEPKPPPRPHPRPRPPEAPPQQAPSGTGQPAPGTSKIETSPKPPHTTRGPLSSSSSSSSSSSPGSPLPLPTTLSNGCVKCPDHPPHCSACPNGKVCQITTQSCHACPQAQCVVDSTVATSSGRGGAHETAAAAESGAIGRMRDKHKQHEHRARGAMIGGMIGGIFLVLVLIFVYFIVVRIRGNKKQQQQQRQSNAASNYEAEVGKQDPENNNDIQDQDDAAEYKYGPRQSSVYGFQSTNVPQDWSSYYAPQGFTSQDTGATVGLQRSSSDYRRDSPPYPAMPQYTGGGGGGGAMLPGTNFYADQPSLSTAIQIQNPAMSQDHLAANTRTSPRRPRISRPLRGKELDRFKHHMGGYSGGSDRSSAIPFTIPEVEDEDLSKVPGKLRRLSHRLSNRFVKKKQAQAQSQPQPQPQAADGDTHSIASTVRGDALSAHSLHSLHSLASTSNQPHLFSDDVRWQMEGFHAPGATVALSSRSPPPQLPTLEIESSIKLPMESKISLFSTPSRNEHGIYKDHGYLDAAFPQEQAAAPYSSAYQEYAYNEDDKAPPQEAQRQLHPLAAYGDGNSPCTGMTSPDMRNVQPLYNRRSTSQASTTVHAEPKLTPQPASMLEPRVPQLNSSDHVPRPPPKDEDDEDYYQHTELPDDPAAALGPPSPLDDQASTVQGGYGDNVVPYMGYDERYTYVQPYNPYEQAGDGENGALRHAAAASSSDMSLPQPQPHDAATPPPPPPPPNTVFNPYAEVIEQRKGPEDTDSPHVEATDSSYYETYSPQGLGTNSSSSPQPPPPPPMPMPMNQVYNQSTHSSPAAAQSTVHLAQPLAGLNIRFDQVPRDSFDDNVSVHSGSITFGNEYTLQRDSNQHYQPYAPGFAEVKPLAIRRSQLDQQARSSGSGSRHDQNSFVDYPVLYDESQEISLTGRHV